jgi:peptidyl-prolyl cis-trans isomerase D
MLQKIRDNTQGAISRIFVWFIIGIFSLWGVDTIVGTFISSASILTVNGQEISELEIESLSQQKAREFYTSVDETTDLSDFDDSVFRESAINELIQRELLAQSAARSGMNVSSASLDLRIAQTPDFQIDGVFNAERANLLLQSIGYTPTSYRAMLASESIINQLLVAFSGTGFSTPVELARVAALTHQKRTFRALSLSLDTQAGEMEIPEADIQAWYDANQAEFVQPEQVRVSYLELDKDDLFDEVMVTEDSIRAAYDEESALFQAQTERRASHILFAASTEEEFTAAMAAATAAKSRIDNGEDFAALALELSDDTGSAQDGGDVGYTTGSNFDEDFEAALRNLQVDEVSGPVRTVFGVHLIKLTEQAETENAPYEERRDDIERQLKQGEVDVLFISRADELGNLAFESLDLQEPAASMGLEIQESEWFSRSGGIGIAAFDGVVNAAFGNEVLEERLNSDLVTLDPNRAVVIHVAEHQPEQIRPLEEVRVEIEGLLRIQKMQEQARLIGETIVASLQAGENVDELLQAQNVQWQDFGNVERGEPTLNPEIGTYVFGLARPVDGVPVYAGRQLSSGNFIVVELHSVQDGTVADFEEGEEASLGNFISQQHSSNDFAGFMMGLEARAEIEGRESSLNPESEF